LSERGHLARFLFRIKRGIHSPRGGDYNSENPAYLLISERSMERIKMIENTAKIICKVRIRFLSDCSVVLS
jgi:hypothetical protein